MSNRTSAPQNMVAGSAVHPVIPLDFDQATRFAQTAVLAGLFQAESQEKALAQATMAVLQGLELGLPPMQAVQQIAMIGGRCTIWGDLVPALIWRAGPGSPPTGPSGAPRAPRGPCRKCIARA